MNIDDYDKRKEFFEELSRSERRNVEIKCRVIKLDHMPSKVLKVGDYIRVDDKGPKMLITELVLSYEDRKEIKPLDD